MHLCVVARQPIYIYSLVCHPLYSLANMHGSRDDKPGGYSYIVAPTILRNLIELIIYSYIAPAPTVLSTVPIKWTTPEAILYKKYTTKSDIWSYGMLMYEIWSLGHKPFESNTVQEVSCSCMGLLVLCSGQSR